MDQSRNPEAESTKSTYIVLREEDDAVAGLTHPLSANETFKPNVDPRNPSKALIGAIIRFQARIKRKDKRDSPFDSAWR